MNKLLSITLGITVATMLFLIWSVSPVKADDIFEETTLGAKVDLPNLVKKGNHSLGAELSITDITNDWDLGSQAFVKYTFSGSIFDFTK